MPACSRMRGATKPAAKIDGVQVQQMLTGGQEVIVGAISDPRFGKLVAFGLGGVLVETTPPASVLWRMSAETTFITTGNPID